MHDGRFESLEQVVAHYNNGVRPHPNLSPPLRAGGPNGPPRRLNLSPQEQAALVAFLKTLTDQAFITDERWSDPFCETAVSTAEPVLQDGWHIYPNPAADEVHVRLDAGLGSSYQLELFNNQGQLIRTYQFSEQEFTVQREGWPAGMYYLKLQSEGQQSVKPLVFR